MSLYCKCMTSSKNVNSRKWPPQLPLSTIDILNADIVCKGHIYMYMYEIRTQQAVLLINATTCTESHNRKLCVDKILPPFYGLEKSDTAAVA